MEKSGKFRLTSLERNWILYDVGNSAFVLMIATLVPIFFNALAEAGGVSKVNYLAYWGYASSIVTVVTAILSPILGTLAAIGIYSMKKRPQAVMMTITNLPNTMPDIVTGISLMLLFIFAKVDRGYVTMALAHITFDVPYVVLSVLPKLKQMNRFTYEAALDLGATPGYALWHVLIPECKQGIVTGALLAFTLSLDDFTISYFTTSPLVQNLSTLIYSATKLGISPVYYALSSLMFVVLLVLLMIVNHRTADNN